MDSVSAMIEHLKWESLEKRRKAASLYLMYKIQHDMVAINANHYTTPMIASNTRQYHPKKLLAIPCSRMGSWVSGHLTKLKPGFLS